MLQEELMLVSENRLKLNISKTKSLEGMHVMLSQIRVGERLACSLVQYIGNICALRKPTYLCSRYLYQCFKENFNV